MELFSVFKFSGLWESGKKMDAPLGSFQKLQNCYVSKNNSLKSITFGSALGNINPQYYFGDSPEIGPEIEWKYIHTAKNFNNNIFEVVFGVDKATKAKSYFGFKYVKGDGSEVISIDTGNSYENRPESKVLPLENYISKKGRSNFTSCTNQRKLFFNYGENQARYNSNEPSVINTGFGLMRFDGIKVRSAGLPLPINHIKNTAVAGSHYARTIYVTMSQDGELIASGYRQDRLGGATVDIKHGRNSDFPATGALDPLPKRRLINDTLYDNDASSIENFPSNAYPTNSRNEMKFFDRSFIHVSGIGFDIVTNQFIFTRGSGGASFEFNNANLGVGKWLMLDLGASNLYGFNGQFMMVQVASHGLTLGSEVRVSRAKIYSLVSFSWEEFDIPKYISYAALNPDTYMQLQATFLNFGKGMTNIWMLIYYSTSATSGYNKLNYFPVFWASTFTTTGVNLAASTVTENILGVINNDLLAWYDDTKSFTRFPPLYGITQYLGLTVGHDDNAIYYNSTAIGGSSEMIDGQSNFTPPSSSFGKITAVCGSESFLFVSRERKNFVIRGDLVGGNFSIVDCDFPCGGAISSNACINSYNDQVIFVTYSGVYAVNSGGSIVELSAPIRSIFTGENLIASHPFKGELLKSLGKVVSQSFDGLNINMAIDETEALLFITFSIFGNDEKLPDGTGQTVKPATLVFNLISGAWSEYQGGYNNIGFATTLDKNFIYGDSLRTIDPSGDKTGANKMSLITSWITAGTPFIQKQIGRLISYGYKISDVVMNIFLDYGIRTSEPTNIEYDTSRYDSEKKMNTEKAASFAIGLDGHYDIEGMEIEMTTIQTSGKR